MNLISPFKGLRPAPDRASDVIAPPYDVLNSAEARERADGKPWSFLHISKPEIDLPEKTDPYSAEVYAKAAENLARIREAGLLVRDEQPCYYAYRLIMDGHSQTGLVAGASVADYDTNRIRKHEFTRPVKEDDRVRQIDAVNAQTGPVLLAYPDAPAVDAILAAAAQGEPALDVTADDGIQHTLWVIDNAESIAQLTAAFNAMHALYIADGHHRSAAASRIAKMRHEQQGSAGVAPWDFFLSVIFPAHQMKIFDYNRVIKDLHGMEPSQFLAAVEEHFTLEPSATPVKPAEPGTFGMYMDGQWFKLTLNPELMPNDDPVARLDVSRLARYLIEPVLGISDPRRDDRIDFVGGIRGLTGLEKRVNSGEMAVAFSLYATSMQDLMSVADNNDVMPPKSTWFEPKLADGVVSYLLD
ncbi:DUF1015 domain-containing protein [Thiothrix lacustris]|uniref:DUF1015 domain-containing protein n=1 Tax=Thiothrix lacustris TaxID=525917 RepID=UPI00049190DC|nr:DUF1015 domain-containing protein [Thiothrix lacustris]